MATAENIVNNALYASGVWRPGQTPSPEHQAYAFDRLKSLMSQYANVNAYCYGTKIAVFTISSSKTTYTLGPSAADFAVTPRPAAIDAVNLILQASQARLPLKMLTADEWGELPLRTLASSIPNQVFCNPLAPNWDIWLFPYPTEFGNQLEFLMGHPLQTFTSLSDTLVAPEGYDANLTAILAEMLCTGLHVPATLDVRDQANRARKNMLNLNSRSTPIRTDIASGTTTTYFNYRDGSLVVGPG